MKIQRQTNNLSDSELTDDQSVCLDRSLFQSKDDNGRLKFMQEKLSRFAERLCIRQRLAETLQLLEHSDQMATKIYKILNLQQQTSFGSQEQITFSDQRIKSEAEEPMNSYDSHWQVIRLIEIVAQKLHHNITSQMEQIKGRQNPLMPQLSNRTPMLSSYDQQQIPQFLLSNTFSDFDQQLNTQRDHLQKALDKQIQINEDLKAELRELRNDKMQLQNEESYIQQELSHYQIAYSQKDKELTAALNQLRSLEKAVLKKKQYEGLVIKASQDLRKKDEECEEKNKAIAKAQQVIMRLSNENEELLSRVDQLTVNSQKQQEDYQLSYNQIMASYKQSQFELSELRNENGSIRNEYEEKLSIIQRQAEEVIRFFKQEAQKKSDPVRIQLFSGEKTRDFRKSKSQVRFNNTFGNLEQSPKSNTKKSLMDSSPLQRSNWFQETNPLQQSQKNLTLGLTLEAYEQTLKILTQLKGEIQTLCEEQVRHIEQITKKSQDLTSDYTEKLDQYLNRETNLNNIIKKKDNQIQDLQNLVFSFKLALEEQRSLYQSQIQQLLSKEEIYKLLEDQNHENTQKLKDQLNQALQSTVELQSSNFMTITQLNQKYEAEKLKVEEMRAQHQEEVQQRAFLESEIEKVYQQIDEEIQSRSFLQYTYDRLIESVKDLWQSECEQFQQTSQMVRSSTTQSGDQTLDMLRDLSEHIKSLKQMNELQKEECYQLLQQISEQSEIISSSSHYHSDTITSANSSIYPQYLRNYSTKNAQPMSLTNKSTIQVSKRNELYHMLRDEIKRMQMELSNYKDQITHYKKQFDKSESIYRMKCDEVTKLIEDNQELIAKREIIQRENNALQEQKNELRQIMEEKEKEIIELKAQVQSFEKDIELVQQQMLDVMSQNQQMQPEREAYDSALRQAQSRMNEMHLQQQELIDRFRQQEERLRAKINKYRSKKQAKEKQIYDLHLKIEQEMRISQEMREEKSRKESLKNVVGIQTEPDQDYLQLIAENQQKHEELSQVRRDITTVLDSYDKLKDDNARMVSEVEDMKRQVHVLQDQKDNLERTLEQEREFLSRVKKVEKSYSKIIGASTCGGTSINDAYQDQSHFQRIGDSEVQEISRELGKLKRHNSQNKLNRNKKIQEDYSTIQDKIMIDHSLNNYRSQQVFQGLPPSKTPSQRGFNVSQINNLQSYDTSICSDLPSKNVFNYQRSGSFLQRNQLASSESLLDKENRVQNENVSTQETKKDHKERSKRKKLMRHFESILGHLLRINDNKSANSQIPPLIKRNNSQNKNPRDEEVLFFKAQTYFYQKSPGIYQKLQALISNKDQKKEDKTNEVSWQIIQIARKLTALCLDGAILHSSDKFQDDLQQAQNLLSQDLTILTQNLSQLNPIIDTLLEGLSHLINSQCSVLIKSKSSEESSLNDFDLSISNKLEIISSRIQSKIDILNQMQEYFQSNTLKSLQKVDQVGITPESVWRFICSLQRLAGALKLDNNYDILNIEQVIKQLPRSNQIMTNRSCSDQYNQNLKAILSEIQSQEFEAVPLTKGQQSSLLPLLDDFDKEFSRINDKSLTRYIDRMIVKIRKQVIQQFGSFGMSNKDQLQKALDDIDQHIRESSVISPRRGSHQNGIEQKENSELGLLLLLKENLQLRRIIIRENK